MKFVRYDDTKLGLLTDDESGVIDLTDRLGLESDEPLVEYIRAGHDASEYAGAEADVAVEDVSLGAPVGLPGKVVSAPSNYAEHVAEMSGGPPTGPSSYFLKAPTSVIGPGDTIELPFSDRRFDHEVELAFLMKRDVKNVTAEEFSDLVFGYTILLDISMRGDEDRSSRKSYDTFTVVGPCVATPDEVGDPQDLDLSLAIDGETRQDSNTEHMIMECDDFVELSTVGTTIRVEDYVTTGTPSGVGPLSDGDVVEAEIENVGALQVDVLEHDRRHEDLDVVD